MPSKLTTSVSFLVLASILSVLYTNCSPFERTQDLAASLASTGASSCELVSASLRRPNSIDDVVQLINAAPKPLSLECFLQNLERPLDVYAVDNTFSAQPSAGPKSPRILVMNAPLVMSVVPAGTGRFLLELGEIVANGRSIKAELEFPIAGEIVMADAFTRTLDTGGFTSCRVCHANESPAGGSFPGNAFVSDVLPPSSFDRVTTASLVTEANVCDPTTYRCGILRAIFSNGRARDGVFP